MRDPWNARLMSRVAWGMKKLALLLPLLLLACGDNIKPGPDAGKPGGDGVDRPPVVHPGDPLPPACEPGTPPEYCGQPDAGVDAPPCDDAEDSNCHWHGNAWHCDKHGHEHNGKWHGGHL